LDRVNVIDGVATEVAAFISRRRQRLLDTVHKTVAINPFLTPLAQELNGYESITELAAFFATGHLLDGHQTGFGKLVDERILPNVWGTTKLSEPFRDANPPYDAPMFGVIDHLVPKDDGTQDLLSLKAGRWSIQLGQALNMNNSFVNLLEARDRGEVAFDRIVIGVLYGTEATLTDKFSIARGVIRHGRAHDVTDISEHVDLYAGRAFWAWLNDGEPETQEWVLEGVFEGMDRAKGELGSAAEAVASYQESFENELARHRKSDGEVDWFALLRDING
jgi:hypothetical protein